MAKDKDNSPLTKYVSCRIREDTYNKFTKKAGDMGMDQSSAVREFIDAFNEGRMTIKPTKEQQKLLKQRKGLYDVN